MILAPAVWMLAIWAPTARADFIGHGGMVRDVAVSPDGSRVLTAGFDYAARIWDFTSQQELGALAGHTAPVDAVAFLSDRLGVSVGDDGRVLLWNLAARDTRVHPPGEDRDQPAQIITGHDGKVVAVAVCPARDTLATASWDHSARLWSVSDGREIARFEHPAGVDAVTFARDGRIVVTGGKDGVIRLWDVERKQQMAELRGHGMAVVDLAISPDGSRLLSAGIDGSVRLWDISGSTGSTATDSATAPGQDRELAVLEGHDGPVFGVAFAPRGPGSNDGSRNASSDGQPVAASVGRDGNLIVWDLQTRLPVRLIAAHDGPAWSVAWTPDGRFILSAGSDGSVRVWHAATGSRIGLAGGPQTDQEQRPRPWLSSDHPGAKLFRACAPCHSLEPDGLQRSGPHFAGLFGRPAGSVPGYDYSPSLRRAGIVWNERTLHALFEQGPDAFVPGSKMPLQRINDEAALNALVDYMKILTAEHPQSTKKPQKELQGGTR